MLSHLDRKWLTHSLGIVGLTGDLDALVYDVMHEASRKKERATTQARWDERCLRRLIPMPATPTPKRTRL